MSEATATKVTLSLSPQEANLVADAIAALRMRDPRREDCMRFVFDHPELELISSQLEPEPEEDR